MESIFFLFREIVSMMSLLHRQHPVRKSRLKSFATLRPTLEVLEDRTVPSGFSDGFEGSTLDSFWTRRQNAGSVLFPSTVRAHGGTQSVRLSSVANVGQKNIELQHTFTAPTFGRVSIWVYDTGADVSSSNYIGLEVQNRAAGTGISLFTQDYDLGPTNGGIYYYARVSEVHGFNVSQ